MSVVNDASRMVITPPTGVGDEIQVTKLPGGGLDIEIAEPWAGSTETGFGATTSVSLTPDLARQLIAWLNTNETP